MTSPLFEPIRGQQVFGPDLPDYDALTDCIRCGRCLPACPTYQHTTLEGQSPRGRLNLLRAVEDGKLALEEPRLEEHLYHCLDCRACDTVCPAGISIGALIVRGRAAIAHVRPRSRLIRFGLTAILVSPRRAEFFAAPLRWMQRLRLDRLGLAIFGRLPKIGPIVRDLIELAPAMSKPLRGELHEGQSSSQANTRRVGFFLGCVMNVAYADASRASVRLMERYGCEVVTPSNQLCCGAPHEDQGMKDTARSFARRNIAAFDALGDLRAIVADCAACSGFLKEYTHLLRVDPDWAERARRFSSKVRDITEWLDEIMPHVVLSREPPEMGRSAKNGLDQDTLRHARGDKLKVTYHEPCHLANVQGVRRPPRALMARLRNVDVCELPDAARCCGSAGIYNLTHPTMSRRLLERKMDDVASTHADVVVSANPGCLLQLNWGNKRHSASIAVRHITQLIEAELLDET